MLMKIIAGVVTALLILTLGAGAMFYLNTYSPMAEDYDRMKEGLPAFDKAKAELKKLREIRDQEKKATAWIDPLIEALNAGLADEVKSGKAEVFAAGGKVVVNIAEQTLYLQGSYTFSQESPQLRLNLAALLKEKAKGKDLYIGNTTQAVPAQVVKRRKKIPGKDARLLAAERSAALIKDLEKNGISPDALIAAAYSSKQPEAGFKIKDRKTIIIIDNPLVATVKQEGPPSPQSAQNAGTAPATPAQSTPIPIQPAQPKTP